MIFDSAALNSSAFLLIFKFSFLKLFATESIPFKVHFTMLLWEIIFVSGFPSPSLGPQGHLAFLCSLHAMDSWHGCRPRAASHPTSKYPAWSKMQKRVPHPGRPVEALHPQAWNGLSYVRTVNVFLEMCDTDAERDVCASLIWNKRRKDMVLQLPAL